MNKPSPPGVLYRSARWTARTAGRLTAAGRMWPSFLIVGAQRAGTTSLYRALIQHPAVVRPWRRKGMHFFDVRYARGLAWYRGHFPLLARAELRRRKLGCPVLTGEGTPYYMFHPLAPRRIARDLPGVRLIVMLRDPVERAYSAHAHELARGFETEPFERAIELEPRRLAGEEERILAEPIYHSLAHRHNAYLARGRYIEQLERLEKLFGRDRMLVLESEIFFSEPAKVYDQVCDFLGLPRTDGIRFEAHNARPRAAMPDPLRRQLTEYFAPYDERLTEWLGRTPTWRR